LVLKQGICRGNVGVEAAIASYKKH